MHFPKDWYVTIVEGFVTSLWDHQTVVLIQYLTSFGYFAADNSCFYITNVLRETAYVAQVKDSKNCLIFDEGAYTKNQSPLTDAIREFCGKVSFGLFFTFSMNVYVCPNNLCRVNFL